MLGHVFSKRKSKKRLAHLPIELLRVVVLEWVADISSIVAFDTAVTAQTQWKQLIAQILNNQEINETCPRPSLDASSSAMAWRWLLSRNFRPSWLYLNNNIAKCFPKELPTPFTRVNGLEIELAPMFSIVDMVRAIIPGCRLEISNLLVTFHKCDTNVLCNFVDGLFVNLYPSSIDFHEVNFAFVTTPNDHWRNEFLQKLLSCWTYRTAEEKSILKSIDLSRFKAISKDSLDMVTLIAPALQTLQLSCQEVLIPPSGIVDALSRLTHLQALHLHGRGDLSPIDSNILLALLPSLGQLRRLEVNRCMEINKSLLLPAIFHHCPYIEEINLSQQEYREFYYSAKDQELSIIPSIQDLNFLAPTATNHNFHLPTLSIRTLRLRQVNIPVEHLILLFMRWGGEVEYLDYSGDMELSVALVETIHSHCPNLCRLRYHPSPKRFATAEGTYFPPLYDLLQRFARQWVSLSLQWCRELQDLSLLSLLPYCVSLVEIEINYFARITSESLRNILDYCPRIQRIDLRNCSHIRCDGIVDAITSSSRVNRPCFLIISPEYNLAIQSSWWRCSSIRQVSEKEFLQYRLRAAQPGVSGGGDQNAWLGRSSDGRPWISIQG